MDLGLRRDLVFCGRQGPRRQERSGRFVVVAQDWHGYCLANRADRLPLRGATVNRGGRVVSVQASAQESGLSLPWYRSLNRAQWKVLLASNLGWTFDGFELFALFVTVGFALRQLLDAALYPQIPQYAGYILAATVFGWAAGGVIGGIVADYIGRKRTMMLAILAYSLTTGLSALAWDWESFAVLRFLVGVAIGSEWATGASIVSELIGFDRTRRVALDVSDRGVAGICRFMDSPQHPGIAALGTRRRAAARSQGAAPQRCNARRREHRADALYGRRSVR